MNIRKQAPKYQGACFCSELRFNKIQLYGEVSRETVVDYKRFIQFQSQKRSGDIGLLKIPGTNPFLDNPDSEYYTVGYSTTKNGILNCKGIDVPNKIEYVFKYTPKKK